jgi:hypothetical protein
MLSSDAPIVSDDDSREPGIIQKKSVQLSWLGLDTANLSSTIATSSNLSDEGGYHPCPNPVNSLGHGDT